MSNNDFFQKQIQLQRFLSVSLKKKRSIDKSYKRLILQKDRYDKVLLRPKNYCKLNQQCKWRPSKLGKFNKLKKKRYTLSTIKNNVETRNLTLFKRIRFYSSQSVLQKIYQALRVSSQRTRDLRTMKSTMKSPKYPKVRSRRERASFLLSNPSPKAFLGKIGAINLNFLNRCIKHLSCFVKFFFYYIFFCIVLGFFSTKLIFFAVQIFKNNLLNAYEVPTKYLCNTYVIPTKYPKGLKYLCNTYVIPLKYPKGEGNTKLRRAEGEGNTKLRRDCGSTMKSTITSTKGEGRELLIVLHILCFCNQYPKLKNPKSQNSYIDSRNLILYQKMRLVRSKSCVCIQRICALLTFPTLCFPLQTFWWWQASAFPNRSNPFRRFRLPSTLRLQSLSLPIFRFMLHPTGKQSLRWGSHRESNPFGYFVIPFFRPSVPPFSSEHPSFNSWRPLQGSLRVLRRTTSLLVFLCYRNPCKKAFLQGSRDSAAFTRVTTEIVTGVLEIKRRASRAVVLPQCWGKDELNSSRLDSLKKKNIMFLSMLKNSLKVKVKSSPSKNFFKNQLYFSPTKASTNSFSSRRPNDFKTSFKVLKSCMLTNTKNTHFLTQFYQDCNSYLNSGIWESYQKVHITKTKRWVFQKYWIFFNNQPFFYIFEK